MSNFPLAYRLTWLPRFLWPSPGGNRDGFEAPPRQIGDKAGNTVRLVFAGDLSAVANRTPPLVDVGLQKLFAGADLVVVNCESPVVKLPHAPFGTWIGTCHAVSPAFLADALGAAAIDPRRAVLSLANNHALDQDRRGLEESHEAIVAIGAQVVGLAGRPPLVVKTGGLAIAFDAFTIWHNAAREVFTGLVRTTPQPWGPEEIGADFRCVVAHWDREFRHFPLAATRSMARQLVASGASLVVGHHAHVIQPVECMDGALVAYGLGDFLGTAWARTRWPLRVGALFVADIATEGSRRGEVVGHALVPFMRLRDGARERLMPVTDLPEKIRGKVAERLDAVIGVERATGRRAATDRIAATPEGRD